MALSCKITRGDILKWITAFFFGIVATTAIHASLKLMTPLKVNQNSTPAAIAALTNMTTWFDMQDSTAYTLVGSKVSVLKDKSSAANNATQGTDANRPSYVASAINSKPAIYSDGTALYLDTSTTMMRNPVSIFGVVQKATDAHGAILAGVNAAYGAFYFIHSYSYNYNESNLAEVRADTVLTLNTPAIVEIDYATTNGASQIWLNNVALTMTANTAWPSGTLSGYTRFLGAQFDARNWEGYVGEFIICDSVSSTQRNNLYSYLKTKWGL